MGNKAGEYNYYLLCKDECSEFVLVYPLDCKAKVAECIQNLLIDSEIGSKMPIKRIHTDGGSEFVNTRVKTILLKEGVKHELSSPYCPQQNGQAERAVRPVDTVTRTLLSTSQLLDKYMREAVRTAAYLLNRVPTSRSPLTLYERFTGCVPRLNHLRKFWSQVHVIRNDS